MHSSFMYFTFKSIRDKKKTFFIREYIILETACKNRTFECCVVEHLYLYFYCKPHASCVTLFKFICSCITKLNPTTPNDANSAHNKLRNFPTKFSMKLIPLFASSWFGWQLCNEITKFVVNFGNFKRSLETVCQKFCETHCNDWWLGKPVDFVSSLFLWKQN